LHTFPNACYHLLCEKKAINYIMRIALRTPADIGALIKDRRRALGLDQAELAERMGVSRLWVNQVERGKPGASLGLVLRAVAAVGAELATEVATGTSGETSAPDSSDAETVFTPDINAIIDAARRGDRR
jgi:HTH-type transcriptional regulator / antitoxin HipB